MKTSRKVLALILSVLLVVTVFAGCNNNTTTSSAAPSTTESKGGDASTDGSGEASRDPITYTLWFGEHASEPYHEDTWVLAPWALENSTSRLILPLFRQRTGRPSVTPR